MTYKGIDVNHRATTAFFELNVEELSKPLKFFADAKIALDPGLESARDKRKIEFLAGRYCAHQGLTKLGIDTDNLSIPRAKTREPLWPRGIVGAITHTLSYAAALVSNDKTIMGLGLDAEKYVEDPRPALIKQICFPEEFDALRAQTALDDSTLLTLIFSAKESLYKALYPSVQRYFGFQAARIHQINTDQSTLSIELTKEVGSFGTGFTLDLDFELRAAHCLTSCVYQQSTTASS